MVWFDHENMRICWGDPKKSTLNVKGFINLKCVREIKDGQVKSKKVKDDQIAKRIFSIVGRFKQLEIEAPTK